MTSQASVIEPAADSLLEVNLVQTGRISILTLCGSLNSSSLHVLEQGFDQLGRTPCREVVLDMSQVDMIDEAGCRVLTGLHHYVTARRGRLTMAGANNSIRDALATSSIVCT